MINKNLSVVTVTYNNAENLNRTLQSILLCPTKPAAVVVIDGGSVDHTEQIVKRYSSFLPINYHSELDRGIYDAMNKGKNKVNTELVHYLNAGDVISGDPYKDIRQICILPVQIIDNERNQYWMDKIKLYGYGYCHQGVIFSSSHPDYSLSYNLASDFHMIARSFKDGLRGLNIFDTGIVHYNLDGVSSRHTITGTKEILMAAKDALPLTKFLMIVLIVIGKSFIPRYVRRSFANISWRI